MKKKGEIFSMTNIFNEMDIKADKKNIESGELKIDFPTLIRYKYPISLYSNSKSYSSKKFS